MQSARALESPVPISSQVTSKLTSRWGRESDGQGLHQKDNCADSHRLPEPLLSLWQPPTSENVVSTYIVGFNTVSTMANVRFTNTGKHYSGVQDVKYEIKIIQKVYSQIFPQK